MWVIVRELVGWVIALIGLGLIGVVVWCAINRMVLEAIGLSIPAAAVFRAGIGLVRMSAASRIAMKLTESETAVRR